MYHRSMEVECPDCGRMFYKTRRGQEICPLCEEWQEAFTPYEEGEEEEDEE